MANLVNLKRKETQYKETVDQANTFLARFRKTISDLCIKLKTMEEPRIEQIHSSINSFVVYEMSAEMNNKYDIGKFAKILEDFNLETELNLVDQFLFGGDGKPRFVPQVANPKFEFVPYTSGFDVNKLS